MKRVLCALTIVFALPLQAQRDAHVVLSEFIYNSAPFASAHASTIEDVGGTLVVAWFGGSTEGATDVGIWLSRKVDGKWTAPVQVADGAAADGSQQACWNPVLFKPKTGPLMLFYKVGRNPHEWHGEIRTSPDGGRSWSAAKKLKDGILGPIKNKPVQLESGTIISPSSTESGDTPPKWRVHFELSNDRGATWNAVAPADGGDVDAIQPTIFPRIDGKLSQALAHAVTEKYSADIFNGRRRDVVGTGADRAAESKLRD